MSYLMKIFHIGLFFFCVSILSGCYTVSLGPTPTDWNEGETTGRPGYGPRAYGPGAAAKALVEISKYKVHPTQERISIGLFPGYMCLREGFLNQQCSNPRDRFWGEWVGPPLASPFCYSVVNCCFLGIPTMSTLFCEPFGCEVFYEFLGEVKEKRREDYRHVEVMLLGLMGAFRWQEVSPSSEMVETAYTEDVAMARSSIYSSSSGTNKIMYCELPGGQKMWMSYPGFDVLRQECGRSSNGRASVLFDDGTKIRDFFVSTNNPAYLGYSDHAAEKNLCTRFKVLQQIADTKFREVRTVLTEGNSEPEAEVFSKKVDEFEKEVKRLFNDCKITQERIDLYDRKIADVSKVPQEFMSAVTNRKKKEAARVLAREREIEQMIQHAVWDAAIEACSEEIRKGSPAVANRWEELCVKAKDGKRNDLIAKKQWDAVIQMCEREIHLSSEKGLGDEETQKRWKDSLAGAKKHSAVETFDAAMALDLNDEKERAKAIGWLWKADSLGDERALPQLASLGINQAILKLAAELDKGVNRAQNAGEAVQWYQKSAETGDLEAMVALGSHYEKGEGVEKSPEEAVKWYRKAMTAGSVEAILRMGLCHEMGIGVARNLNEATTCYRSAMDKGSVEARAKYEHAVDLLNGDFNGIKFGVNISEYGSARLVDNSYDRRFLQSSGTHKLSYKETSYKPNKVFRVFNHGGVRASWETEKVYEVYYWHPFDRSGTTASDREELRQTVDALCRKYGSPVRNVGNASGEDDCTFEWRKDDMRVVLEYISEGVLTQSSMTLTASSLQGLREAWKESEAYYKQRLEKDRSRVSSGGEDAL